MKDLIGLVRQIYNANKQLLSYLFFGVCTVALNAGCYWLLYEAAALDNISSTVLSWVAAVVFAFVTNKIFVFQSRRTTLSGRMSEFISFFGCRLLTGVLDVAIMAVAVDMLKWNGLLWKLISNILVTVINYCASKFLIFREIKRNS